MTPTMMTTRLLLSRTILAGPARTAALRAQQRTLSTTPARPTNNNNNTNNAGNGNPSYPAFSLNHISANPRVRYALAAALLGLGFVEGAAWMKFWPKIMGRDVEGEGEGEAGK